MLADLRYATRLLRKSPGFALTVILTLGLGIGANTAVFSFANALLLNPVSLPDLDRLVMVLDKKSGSNVADWSLVSAADFADFRLHSSSFERMSAYRFADTNLSGDREPEQLRGAIVASDFFETLSVKPTLGRTFARDEFQPGHDQVVVLSHAIWQRDFGANPNLPGSTIRLNGKTFTVLGVMPNEFRFPISAQLWMPLAMDAREAANRATHSVAIIGRLKPDVSIAQGSAEIATIATRLQTAYPSTNNGWSIMVQPVREFVSGYYTRHYLFMLLGAVLFVLLIACANIANLQFARASVRAKEMAVRTALGAGRFRLIRQLLTESILLSLLGAAVGVVVGTWALDLLRANMPPEIARYIAGWDRLGLNSVVLSWTVCASVLAGVLSGLAPALQNTRDALSGTLKESGRGTSAGRQSQRLRSFLVIAQVALALTLLVGASLMVKGTRALIGASSQYRPETLLTLSFSLPDLQYPGTVQRASFYDQIMARVASIPLTHGVALSTTLPSTNAGSSNFEVDGQPVGEAHDYPAATPLSISPGYFGLLGATLMEGREFRVADNADSPPVTIVNQKLARKYWPGRSPIGRRIRYGRGNGKFPWMTVVGVAADVKYDWGERDIQPTIYRPYRQAPLSFSYLIVRTNRDPLAVAEAVRREISAVDKELPLFEVATLERAIANSVIGLSYVAVMLSATGGIALVLACVGVFGVMAFSVSERTHEIGIRMALGAAQSDVLGLVAAKGLALTATGIGIGLAGSIALARLMSNLIFGVSATDITTLSAVSILLLGLAMLACYAPTRRAMRVDPIQALRQD